MTDYFALLEQPRAPWLDPVALKEAFHRKTLQAHPDSAHGTQDAFAELNEAYRVLQDPKHRLYHLLSLKNQTPPANQTAPADLEELFLEIGAQNQNASRLLEKIRVASNPLSKSVLRAEIVSTQQAVRSLSDKVQKLYAAAESRLQQTETNQLDKLADLYQRFAYLGRWSAQLDELAFQFLPD